MTRASNQPTDAAQAILSTIPDAPQAPKQRRKRGPNKPKPVAAIVGSIAVRTEASMSQDAIVELLAAHVASDPRIGSEAAAEMELQVNVGDGWKAPSDRYLGVENRDSPPGVAIRFATKGHK